MVNSEIAARKKRLIELNEQAQKANMITAGVILKEAFAELLSLQIALIAEIEQLKAELAQVQKQLKEGQK